MLTNATDILSFGLDAIQVRMEGQRILPRAVSCRRDNIISFQTWIICMPGAWIASLLLRVKHLDCAG